MTWKEKKENQKPELSTEALNWHCSVNGDILLLKPLKNTHLT